MPYDALKPLLFRLSPSRAHAVAHAALGVLEASGLARAAAARLVAGPAARVPVRALGLDFASPVGLAGGFDKTGDRARALSALGFGFLEVGTVTAEAQEANPAPNLFRLPADRALVNRLGFPNEGARALAARLAASLPAPGAREVPVAVSIGKTRRVPFEPLEGVVDDYLASFAAVRDVADFVVVNVSSPNTTGLRGLQTGEVAKRLLGALANAAAGGGAGGRAVPLLVKIAPDLDDAGVVALARTARELGLAGVVATNTTLARAGLKTPAAEVEALGAGGLSGPPLAARARAVVRLVRGELAAGACVVGVGGVTTVDDVLALASAGADLVQLYTAFVYEGPGLPGRLARELAARVGSAGWAGARGGPADGDDLSRRSPRQE